MTKLFVNGCSFTAGNGEVHTADGNLAPPLDYVWANQIPAVESITNLAIRGGSNDRILRTTMEYFNCRNAIDYVAVIQWTSPLRFERYAPTYNAFAGFCNTGEHYSLHLDNGVYLEKSKIHTKLTHTATQLLKYGKSINDYNIDYYKKIIIMQQYLESKNIPYIFTSMSSSSHVNTEQNNTPYELQLKNMINKDTWTEYPLNRYQQDNFVSEQDTHPNEIGHKLIADSVYEELKQRNYV